MTFPGEKVVILHVDCRDRYDEFYKQLVREKDIATLPPFCADNAQKLLVKYIR